MHTTWALLLFALASGLGLHFLRGRVVDHRYLLCFGLMFYLVVPFHAFGSGIYWGGPGHDIWERAFEPIYEQGAAVLATALVFVVAFVAADRIPVPPHARVVVDRPFTAPLLWLAFAGLSALCAAYAWQARELLFSGYLLDYRPDLLGPLASVNLAALLLLLNVAQWRQSRRLLWAFGALLAINSVVLLSMGGRLYVAAPLVGLTLMALDSPRGRLPSSRALALLVALLVGVVFVLVGLLRVDMDVDLATAFPLLLAEPLLTSVSLGTLLDCPIVDWFAVPANYASSIINLIPSGVLPRKEELMVDLDPGGNCLAAPFGATHLATALLVNFGWLGGLLVVMLFAWAMNAIRGRRGWWLYYYLCSLVPFMLFRDGFLIFNKAFFGTGLLLGLTMSVLSRSRQDTALLEGQPAGVQAPR